MPEKVLRLLKESHLFCAAQMHPGFPGGGKGINCRHLQLPGAGPMPCKFLPGRKNLCGSGQNPDRLKPTAVDNPGLADNPVSGNKLSLTLIMLR